MANINTASGYGSLTKDKYDAQKYITKEMGRVENMQNYLLNNTDKITNTVMNGYRTNALNEQASVLNNETANLYSSNVARQNEDIVRNQTTSELQSIASENGANALSDVSSFFTKGVGALYNLENYKRQMALKEAQTVFDIKKGVANLNLGWADYDLNNETLEFTKETNKRNEALTADE